MGGKEGQASTVSAELRSQDRRWGNRRNEENKTGAECLKDERAREREGRLSKLGSTEDSGQSWGLRQQGGGGAGWEQIPGFGDRVRMPRSGVEWVSGGGRFTEQRENSDAWEAREASTFLTYRQSPVKLAGGGGHEPALVMKQL